MRIEREGGKNGSQSGWCHMSFVGLEVEVGLRSESGLRLELGIRYKVRAGARARGRS